MFIWRSNGVVRNCTAVIVLMLVLAPVGMCQTTPEQESEPASSDALEEIVVYGDKSLIQLRREFYRAEADFFAVFNSLNSNDEFDIRCKYVTNLGSRRKYHFCQPKFAYKAEGEATREGMATAGINGYLLYLAYLNRVELTKKNELLWQEMTALVSENMELQKAFADVTEAKQIYESASQKR